MQNIIVNYLERRSTGSRPAYGYNAMYFSHLFDQMRVIPLSLAHIAT
jgi:hypothetical protein